MDYTGNVLPTVNPGPWPEGLRGIAPPRLDHTLVTAPEPGKAIEFFQTVLEFRLSEMLVAPDGTIIAGEGRYLAARKLGLLEAPVS